MKLSVVGILLLILALAVAGIQLRAHRCPRHQKSAGILAWIIVVLCSIGGAVLLMW
ncbi:hypothetical protein MNBD_GAMMA13-377 [hydrothermal vent metagenome]|uniref:Uncharacterized protein n=1 Tax=hydrothermal vent metagenome TaxID=652676 RepID=A0A3B0YDF8_9ZZZZ